MLPRHATQGSSDLGGEKDEGSPPSGRPHAGERAGLFTLSLTGPFSAVVR